MATEGLDILGWCILAAGLFPALGALLCHVWEATIRPCLIPIEAIKALADQLIAKHGPEAEEVAVTNEDRAWRYSDPFEQGKWRRVRHELWRRFEGGKGRGGR